MFLQIFLQSRVNPTNNIPPRNHSDDVLDAAAVQGGDNNNEEVPIPEARLNVVPDSDSLIEPTSHWCHSRDFAEESGKRASCLFHHICVVPTDPRRNDRKQEIKFLYVSSDDADGSQEEEDVSFTLGVGPHSVDERVHFVPERVTAELLQSNYPVRQYVKDLSVLFYEYNAENFGHMLTDVLMPIYVLLESFQLEHQPANLFRYSIRDAIGWSCDYHIDHGAEVNYAYGNVRAIRAHCERFYKLLSQLVGGHSPLHVLNETTVQPTCFERLAVGMSMYSDDCLEGSHGRNQDVWSLCNHARQRQFWNFRNYALANAGAKLPPPPRHKITITIRSDAKRGLKNVDELISVIKNKYSAQGIEVVTVEWHKLSLVDQLKLIQTTTVHLTPPGGASFIALFLPKWATSIRLYTREYRMEYHIFHYLGYIHAEHVDCQEKATIPVDETMNLLRKSMQRYDTFRIADGDKSWESQGVVDESLST